MRKAKAKRRANGKSAAEARRRRAKARAKRVAAIEYVCVVCGKRWGQDPDKRIPTRPPKYCSQSCTSRAQYMREKEREAPTTRERAGYGGRVAAVLALGGELTARRVSEALGYSQLYARQTLIEMYGRGHLERVRRGVYVEKGEPRG